MSAFKQFAERTASALRKLAAQPSAKLPEVSQAAPAAPDNNAKPYKIMVRNAAGELEPKLVTAAEAAEYCNSPRAWRRIA